MTLIEHTDDRLVFKAKNYVMIAAVIGMGGLLIALGPLIWEETGFLAMIVAYLFGGLLVALGVLQIFTSTMLILDRNDGSVRYVRRQLGRRYADQRALADIAEVEVETRRMSEDSTISKLHFRAKPGSGETTMTVQDFADTSNAIEAQEVMSQWLRAA